MTNGATPETTPKASHEAAPAATPAAAPRTREEVNANTLVRGAEFREFYKEHWPSEWCVDDIEIDFEDELGRYVLPDDGVYPLGKLGWAVWQGPAGGRYAHGDMIPVWQLYAEVMCKPKATDVFVGFKVPADKVDELVAAAAALGARLV